MHVFFAMAGAAIALSPVVVQADHAAGHNSTCELYCSAQATNCVGNNTITFTADCTTDCAAWPAGEANATAGHSQECRLYHAGAPAASDPDLHCPHASPGGGGVCADSQTDVCTDYCAIQATNCNDGTNNITFAADCATDCAAFPLGTPADTSGNTAGCRLYHAGAPAASDPALHCPHAAPDGGGVCVDSQTDVCADYCAALTANCAGDNAVAFAADCATDCAAFPLGTPADTAGNTAGCRLYHAGAPAASDPALHCPHASPGGGGVCADSQVDVCTEYCAIQATNCNDGTNNITFAADCATDCAAFKLGTPADTSGNTAGCRLYHAGAPAASDPALHCPHAAPDGGGVCVDVLLDVCVDYCAALTANCGGDNAVTFASDCATDCAAFPLGSPVDIAGNTAGCRLYHAGAPAASDPELHCPHAAPDGGGVCVDAQVDVCVDYCAALTANCGGDNEVTFAADCATDCAAFPLGTPADISGNTAGCRLYHAGAPAASDPALHCPHAAPDGGGVCADSQTDVCVAYCAAQAANCAGDNAIAFAADCAADCAAFPLGTPIDTAGNTAGCRLYHAGAPAASDPALHCPHAAPAGGGVCVDAQVDVCVDYCAALEANCGGDNAVTFSSTCAADCAAFPLGTPADTAGDTAGCRLYHAGAPAASDPALHCPHAAPGGGGVCADSQTDVCAAYCSDLTSNCNGTNSITFTVDCVTDCAAYNLGTPADTSGDTAGCRRYHAGAPAASDPALHCPHASPDGGDVCVAAAASATTTTVGNGTVDLSSASANTATMVVLSLAAAVAAAL